MLPEGAGPGHGHEHVRPHERDLALDAPLLVAGVGVAEPGLETAVGPEAAEELGEPHLVGDAPADARRVVEGHQRGHAADVEGDVLEALANALWGRAAGHLEPAHARVRERGHEEAHPLSAAGRVEVGLPEVDLRRPGLPLEAGERLPGPRAQLAPPLLHVLLHGGAAAVVAVLPYGAVDPPRRVALLAPGASVRLEHPVDPRLVGVELRGSGRPDRWPRREVGLAEELPDRLAVVPRDPRYLGDAMPLRVKPSYIIGLWHVWYPSCTSSRSRWLGPQRPEARTRVWLSACHYR